MILKILRNKLTTDKVNCSSKVLKDITGTNKHWNYNKAWIKSLVSLSYKSLKYRVGLENPNNKKRERIVVLGSGFAAINFLKWIDVSKYDVVVISPRSYFTFNPLLPSVAGGAANGRSVLTPILQFLRRGNRSVMKYEEGVARDINIEENLVHIVNKDGQDYTKSYDYLILAVGSTHNTFNIPGALENSLFLKEVEDAEDIRNRVLSNFYKARLPNTHESDIHRLLHFVFVGGGPSAIETAAELGDFINFDLKRYFPDLVEKSKISVVEMLPRLLSVFNPELSAICKEHLNNTNITTLLNSSVNKVTPTSVFVKHNSGNIEELPCGMVMWAAGIGQNALGKLLRARIPQQNVQGPPALAVDERLLIKGISKENIFALGDCGVVQPTKLQEFSEELFQECSASKEGAGTAWLKNNQHILKHRFIQMYQDLKLCHEAFTLNGFKQFLGSLDASVKPPPPTAQNAKQQGIWLATVFNEDLPKLAKSIPAYHFDNKGMFCYLGRERAVADTPFGLLRAPILSGFIWKCLYMSMIHKQNKLMLFHDYFISTPLFGRNTSLLRNNSFRNFSGFHKK